MLKKVVLFTLGGTISAKGKDQLDLKDYTSGLVEGTELLQQIPNINELANIHTVSIDHVSSTQINEHHWVMLKEQIEYYLKEENFDGAVITHGTNTIEETAYFLHLTVNSNKPIVLVGAQRPVSAISTDVHLNLLNAIQVASSNHAKGYGVIVLLNNELHSARDVTKGQTYRLDAFHSGDFGALGIIDGDHTVQFYRKPVRCHTISSDFSTLPLQANQFPNVEIVYSYAGAKEHLINYITNSGKYDGIVVAGTGAGRFSKVEETALQKARAKGLHVVRSSRVGSGRVVDIDPYDLLKGISSDNLLPQKARILLMLALLKYNDQKAIQQVFLTH